MTRSLLTPFLWVFFSLPVHAGSVEFAQWIPWKFVSQELRKNEFLMNVSETKVPLSLGELRPVLSGVTLTSRLAINEFTPHQNAISLSGEGSITLGLESFTIDQTIERVFGGNVLQIHLEAKCSAARVNVSHMKIHSVFDLTENGASLPELKDLALEISAGEWSVSPITCSGLGGIGAEIENSLNLAMKDPVSLSLLVRNWMKPYLDQWIKSQWMTVSQSEGEWANLTINSPGENGLYLRGELPLSNSKDIVLDNLPVDPSLDIPRFYISREGWLELAQEKLRNLIPQYYDLRQNESFRKLLQSRLMQFFAWPDLRRFHSSTPFVLKIDPGTMNLNISEIKGQKNAVMSGSGSMTTVIGGSPIDYLIFKARIAGPIDVKVVNGSLVVSTGKSLVSLDWKFAPFYQLLYSPDQKVPVQIMSGALAALVSDKKQSVKLPIFKIADKEYVLGNLRIDEQLLTMDWL